jgi:hypothetical protein
MKALLPALLGASLMATATLAQTAPIAPRGELPSTVICFGALGSTGKCVDAVNPLPVGQKPGVLTPLGPSQLGLAVSTATHLTPPMGATVAIVTVESQAIRWRDDGPAPTATAGHPVQAGAQLVYSGDLSAIQIIQQAASATVDVAYYQ